jgi:hypothetical protein
LRFTALFAAAMILPPRVLAAISFPALILPATTLPMTWCRKTAAPLNSLERTTKRVDLALIRGLLHLGKLKRLKDLLHLLEHVLQRTYDARDLQNRLGN